MIAQDTSDSSQAHVGASRDTRRNFIFFHLPAIPAACAAVVGGLVGLCSNGCAPRAAVEVSMQDLLGKPGDYILKRVSITTSLTYLGQDKLGRLVASYNPDINTSPIQYASYVKEDADLFLAPSTNKENLMIVVACRDKNASDAVVASLKGFKGQPIKLSGKFDNCQIKGKNWYVLDLTP